MSEGDPVPLARSLFEEATRAQERRLLVIAGDREAGYATVERIVDALPITLVETVAVTPLDRLRCERVSPNRATDLLGSTKSMLVFDAHDELRPSRIGALSGVVAGGGLLLLLCPSLETWPMATDSFDASLVVEPYTVEDVGHRFRRRFVETLRTQPGIAIVALGSDGHRILRRGHTEPPPRSPRSVLSLPDDHRFPTDAYAVCRTADQVAAVRTLERLGSEGQAVVLEADRGRGKSYAVGIAAACFAHAGESVVVTAPAFRNAEEVFAGARATLERLNPAIDGDASSVIEVADTGGTIRFVPAADLATLDGVPEILFVDEAAGIPVRTLRTTLAAGRVAYATTVHGYEGVGRGFSVRFRSDLEAAEHRVTECHLHQPIRYAAGDPVEIWAFRALLLDARPPAAEQIDDARPETVRYRAIASDELAGDEGLLRSVFGLLVSAHYRTDPDDLARVLDAPNLQLRALTHDGLVVSAALLAEEGGLSLERSRSLYEGERIAGHMLPDLLASQLRDETAGTDRGIRIVRIATHPAVRSRGLGTELVAAVRSEFERDVSWIGTAFGATPDLLSFWADCGLRPIHLSTTRNDRSGEHSVVMLRGTERAGAARVDRHEAWFVDRLLATVSGPLAAVDPDVIRATMRASAGRHPLELADREWRLVAAAAYGPGHVDTNPGPFRRLALTYLLEAGASAGGGLRDRQERLLVAKVLQGRPWEAVADEMGYESVRTCMRALGRAYRPLVDRYGSDAALDERRRYRPDR